MDAIRQAALQSGMRGMFEDGLKKVAHGLTIREEIERVAPPPEVEDDRPAHTAGERAERVVVHGQHVLAVVAGNSSEHLDAAVAPAAANVAAQPTPPAVSVASAPVTPRTAAVPADARGESTADAARAETIGRRAGDNAHAPAGAVASSEGPAPPPAAVPGAVATPATAPSVAPQVAHVPALPPLPRMRLVVLSASTDVVEAVRSALGPDEHDVVGATTGSQALASLRDVVPDLVIAEHNAEAAATVLLKIMRSDVTLKSIPVLLVSSGGDVNAEITALAAGADDFLPLPFSAGVFVRRLRRIIARSPRKAVA